MTGIEIMFTVLLFAVATIGTIVMVIAKRSLNSIDKISGDTGVLTADVRVLSTQFEAHAQEQDKTNKRVSTNIKDLYEKVNK